MNRTDGTIHLESIARLHSDELARISHALKTPLTSIIGFASAILNDPDLSGETSREFSRIIKSEGERLSRFVDELLYVSFGGPVVSASARDEVDPTQLVLTAVRLVSTRMSQPGSRFSTEFTDLPPTVSLDRNFATKMLSNVISNAARFSPYHSNVVIGCSASSGQLLVQVRSKRRGGNLALRTRHDRISPRDAEAVGLARTRYLLMLHGADLTIRMEDHDISILNVIFPLDSATVAR